MGNSNKDKESIFNKPGPVKLGSEARGIHTLGDIRDKNSPSAYESMTIKMETPTPIPDTVENSEIRKEPESPSQEIKTESIMTVAPVFSQGIEVTREKRRSNLEPSAPSSWSSVKWTPKVNPTAFVHPSAVIIGNVEIDAGAFIAAGVLIRCDNDEPIYIGRRAYLQEGAIIRDLPTGEIAGGDSQRTVEHFGMKYSVYIGEDAVIAPQAQVHGPAKVEKGAYIGMQSLIFWAVIGEDVVVEPACVVMNVLINKKVFVPAGLKVTTNKQVGDLPPLTKQYRFNDLSKEITEKMGELLKGYKAFFE